MTRILLIAICCVIFPAQAREVEYPVPGYKPAPPAPCDLVLPRDLEPREVVEICKTQAERN